MTDEIIVPARLGSPMEEYEPEPFPLVAWWARLPGTARAFVVGLAGLFVSIGYLAGPGWAGAIVSAIVIVDAMGLSFGRGGPTE